MARRRRLRALFSRRPAGSRARRRPRAKFAVSALLLALFAAVVTAPQTAGALGFDCTDAPAPEVPGRGLTGFFSSAPDPLPAPGDPFAANATTTIYEQYGYAGLRWNNYDLGCGPDATRAPDAVAGTAIANWLYNMPKVAVAFTNAVVGVAFSPSFFSVFDPVVADVSDALFTNVFAAWVPLTLAATGFLLIWRARRANLATTAAAVGWAALVLVLATALFRWPVEAGSAADASMSAVLTSVSQSVGGQPAAAAGVAGPGSSTSGSSNTAAATHEALLYNAWAAGTFGDATSETARRYGPAIFDASALTWREAATLKADPAAGKKIVDAKQRKFSQTAERIKSEDPDAYQYLTGKRSDARVGYALLATFGALCALPFLFGAALLVLASFLIVRLAVMLFPAVATLGVFPAMRHTVTGIGSMVAGALVNALLFGIAAAVALRGIELLLAPGTPLPQWLAMTLLLVFSAVLWIALRPARRLALMLGADVRFSRPRLALARYLRRRGPAPEEADEEADAPQARPDRAEAPLRAEAFSLAEGTPAGGAFRAAPPEPFPLRPAPVRPAPVAPATTAAAAFARGAPRTDGAGPLAPAGLAGTSPAGGSRPGRTEQDRTEQDRAEPNATEPVLRGAGPAPAEALPATAAAPRGYAVSGTGYRRPVATVPQPNLRAAVRPEAAPARSWSATGRTGHDADPPAVPAVAEPAYDRPPGPSDPGEALDSAADLSGIYRPGDRRGGGN